MLKHGSGKPARKFKKKKIKKSIARSAGHTSSKSFEIAGVFLLAFALLSCGGLLNFNVGFVGLSIASVMHYVFGMGAWLAVLLFFALSGQLILQHKPPAFSVPLFCGLDFFIFILAIFHHFFVPAGAEILPEHLAEGGGLLGGLLLFLVRKLFGVTGGIIVVCAGAVASLVGATGWSLAKGFFATKTQAEKGAVLAKDTLTSTYQKMKENTEKNEVGKPASFYNQAKEGVTLENMSSAQPGLAEKEPVTHAVYTDTVEPLPDNDYHKKMPLPRVTNEHSIIEPPDWSDGSAVSKTVNEREAALEPSAGQAFSQFYNTGVLTEQPADAAMSAQAGDLMPAKPAPEVNVDGEKTESATAESTEETALPSFTIQYSRVEENGATVDDYEAESKDTVAQCEQKSYETELQEEVITASGLASLENPVEQEFNSELVNEFTDKVKQVAPPDEQPALVPYIMPQVEELLQPAQKMSRGALEQEIAEHAAVLARTLENFKVKATIVNACHGPAVTRYEVELAPGVKVSKITNLSEDLALSLAVTAVRIVPISGKPYIGIEVPNKELEGVHLSEVLTSREFISAKSPLTVGLGMDISGQPITADLAKMPHLLVAGATGSGKSVCINTLITSILFKAHPDEVKFILIDPKMVELSNYNGIPHLMVPVVTDMRKAAGVLNWTVLEMEKRYSLFAAAGVRDMARYNGVVDVEHRLPAVVIIIDELADLMMVSSSHDVEDAICRLAQKARAAGIHLVLATQRPSVDVITGTIKNNIPSRISFAVSSQTDSRTILDTGGAEMLLGKGDMLFLPMGASKPQRVQGAFISDEEVTALIDFIMAQGQKAEHDQGLLSFTENIGKEEITDQVDKYDELLPKAVDLAISTGSIATSSLQRKFHIGYGRAGALVDTMEELQIVGPKNGTKPRDILVTAEEAQRILGL